MPKTNRADKGFGSTGYTLQKEESSTTPDITNKHTTCIHALQTTIHASQLEINFIEPVYTTTVEVKNNKKFPSLGLQLWNDSKGPIISHCTHGSPTAKIHSWKQILKNARLYAINEHAISRLLQMLLKSLRI